MFADRHQPTQSDVVLGNQERQAKIPTNDSKTTVGSHDRC
jgi:hypothetical protein